MKEYKILPIICLLLFLANGTSLFGQSTTSKVVKVYPKEINDVLNNPGIGFTTFQRFNGDELNSGNGWTEGYPIEYQEFNGDLSNKDYPNTSIAYYRVVWNFLETGPGVYNWDLIDKALKTSAERGQTLMLRISPYDGEGVKDAPIWYKEIVGKENLKIKSWRVDPESPEYIRYFGGMIAALGQRYDGHPDLEAVDVSIVGLCGEGSGMYLLADKTRLSLINSYLDNFKKTHLIFQPLNGDAPRPERLVKGTNIAAYWPDGTNNGEGSNMRNLGWRIDCLGDLGYKPTFSHMGDIYPQDIIRSGMSEAWKKAPITMEICHTFLRWLENEKYDEKDVNYIFEQALKWHVSSFNAKSSPVPERWSPLVNDWLKKMGYRFVLRKFSYPSKIKPHGQLLIKGWIENKGVAPIYKDYKFAVRLKNKTTTKVFSFNVDIRDWLPGDVYLEDKLYIPNDMPLGDYQIEVAIVDPVMFESRVKLAIEGINDEGWYSMGEVNISNK
ncbi:DUF4832 domain-containing protein [Aurantibacter crassamenti]|uniref:DUF4832 domain-containing protein n=1 Tax=Aurantibacter crassamenti TaxID=1837375 RepID=UPI001939A477|nr:DUF4832 domain-containing protein [Aurantibacter crassamenti]MBM1105636.1 DUF4832 domain-containing protein [Aurantibacter crassamenti]